MGDMFKSKQRSLQVEAFFRYAASLLQFKIRSYQRRLRSKVELGHISHLFNRSRIQGRGLGDA